ncbi:MAG: hypothetical protein ACRCX8_10380 [Sarcina sp.]
MVRKIKKICITKANSTGALRYTVDLPAELCRRLEVTKDNRDVEVTLEGDTFKVRLIK